MPLLRFRLFRAGYSALTSEHRASSPEELAESLSLVPQRWSWPGTLTVFRCVAPPGSDLPGFWELLAVSIPLADGPTVLTECQTIWPRAVEVGHDYDRLDREP